MVPSSILDGTDDDLNWRRPMTSHDEGEERSVRPHEPLSAQARAKRLAQARTHLIARARGTVSVEEAARLTGLSE